MEQFLYIASCDPHGGILHCRLSDGGNLEMLEHTALDRPMWLCRDKQYLYALLREPFPGESGLAAFEIQAGGKLCPTGSIQPTSGTIGCHALAAWEHIYAVHYASGTVSRLPETILNLGEGAHPHYAVRTPEGEFLCICDLGRDCILVCTPDLVEVSRVQTAPGTGPRHLVFSPDGCWAYSSDELSSTVSVFRYAQGQLTWLNSVPCIPEKFREENYPSAIRLSPDGTMLYVANRGHDSVCIFHVDGPLLSGRYFLKTEDTWPREMNLLGNFLLCGNQNCVTVFSRETGQLASRFPVKSPWCILPADG
ncbi:MAG: lactonase family protein [Oscillospiraceae bacterium]|nr:lactonase family protein [Oscillospiraceae bacterium]